LTLKSSYGHGYTQEEGAQEALWYGGALPETPGHPFYSRLNEVLDKAGFDRFCEACCVGFYHAKLGRPSLPPGLYFRIMMIGFFEGLDSERGIAWRLADSLTLRQFLSIGLDEQTPDHVTISRTRRLIDGETHQRVFTWVLERLAQGGLIKGKTIGVDSTTLEANAAMKSIVRRDTGESYTDYLKRLAIAEGVNAEDAAAVRRMDRKRAKKMSNDVWENPNDPEAEITRLKDGRTELAYKAENAVDMETGAIVAVTTHGGAAADTATVEMTVLDAAVEVAGLIAEVTPEGEYKVHADGVEEVVADKGYHSNDVVGSLTEMELRTYIAEPERGERHWEGKATEKEAVYAIVSAILGAKGIAKVYKDGHSGTWDLAAGKWLFSGQAIAGILGLLLVVGSALFCGDPKPEPLKEPADYQSLKDSVNQLRKDMVGLQAPKPVISPSPANQKKRPEQEIGSYPTSKRAAAPAAVVSS
jgi:transposase